MSGSYDDIIGLARPESRRKKMSLYDRAAQFSPFAALTGHDAAIRETERLTEADTELAVDAKQMLDEQLRLAAERIDERPAVQVQYFQPDPRKEGGALLRLEGRLLRVDAAAERLIFTDGQEIPFSAIRSLCGQSPQPISHDD